MNAPKSCATCKHHSHTQRPQVVGVFDADLEMIEEDDEVLEDVYLCTHAQRTHDLAAIGQDKAVERARDCSLFATGQRSALSPQLERLLAQSAARASVARED